MSHFFLCTFILITNKFNLFLENKQFAFENPNSGTPPPPHQARAYLFSDSLGKQSCPVDYYRIEGLYEYEEYNNMLEHGHTSRSIYKDGLIELHTHFIAFKILFV